MARMTVASTPDRFRYDIGIRQFQLTADEPIDIGGTDAGPTPTELVFSGLGACKAITLKMYAARKDWPLDAVDAQVEVAQVEVAQVDRRYRVSVQLTLTGDLTEEQRQRLLEISNKCPVHKLLSPGAEIETVLV